MAITKLEAQRYLRLVDELGQERGKRYGWMAEAARQLGIHRSTLAKVLKGERPVTRTHLLRAGESLGLPLEYFAAEGDERHYREWLPPPGIVELDLIGALRERWREELEAAVRAARVATSELRAARTRRDAGEAWQRLLNGVQTVKLIAAYEAARDLTTGADAADVGELHHAAFRLVYELEELAQIIPEPGPSKLGVDKV